ncbi:MAG: hypothetical protein E7566_00415 [Ruminococcaceae bacterium]|nr:hypothetical protein [Oscillospiraceae bacterium]
MQYFDLHCDTLYEAVTKKTDISNLFLEANVSSGKKFDKWCQCMAIWIPDGIRQSARLSLFKKAYNQLKTDAERFRLKQFNSIGNNDNYNYIFTIENASILDGNIDNIKLLTEYGIKMATLTWNDKNSIGGGADTQELGLSDFGRICVKEFEKNGIIIDISHASDKTFFDVLECSSLPFCASHSNSRFLCSHRRNITDEQFLEIARRKGVVGINFHKDFLNDNRERASITDVLKHIEHFLSLGGEDTVCFGSDFDGADPVDELSNLDKISNLYESLLKLGYNEQLVQKIMYNNAYNFFSRF